MPVQASVVRTSAATREHMRLGAERCASDPAKLAKAVRTVHAGIRLGLIDPINIETGGAS